MDDALSDTLAAATQSAEKSNTELATGHARYTRGRELGRGGMGRVVEAIDTQFRRTVAVKELRPGVSAERFVGEAMVTGNLEHPGIPAVFERGVLADGAPFYAMQKVRGRTLEALLAEAKTLEERLALLPAVVRVAEALGYAHERGVVHRDVKPANVVVGPHGEVVLLDWGIARVKGFGVSDPSGGNALAGSSANSTADGAIVGTPAFMAPEQAAARSDALDERTDVYALGVLLYLVLTGQLPYEAKTVEHTLLLAKDGKVTPVLAREPSAPAALVAVCEKAMRASQVERHRNAHEFAAALREVEGRALLETTPNAVRALVMAVPIVAGMVTLAVLFALFTLSQSLQHHVLQAAIGGTIALLGVTLSLVEWRTRGRHRLEGLAFAFALATFFGGLASLSSGLVVTGDLANAAPTEAEWRSLMSVGLRESAGAMTFGVAMAIVQLLIWAVCRRASRT